MTDVDCLYTNNPRTHPDAKPIEVVDDISMLKVDGSLPTTSKLSQFRRSTQTNLTHVYSFHCWFLARHRGHVHQADRRTSCYLRWCNHHHHTLLHPQQYLPHRPLHSISQDRIKHCHPDTRPYLPLPPPRSFNRRPHRRLSSNCCHKAYHPPIYSCQLQSYTPVAHSVPPQATCAPRPLFLDPPRARAARHGVHR